MTPSRCQQIHCRSIISIIKITIDPILHIDEFLNYKNEVHFDRDYLADIPFRIRYKQFHRSMDIESHSHYLSNVCHVFYILSHMWQNNYSMLSNLCNQKCNFYRTLMNTENFKLLLNFGISEKLPR